MREPVKVKDVRRRAAELHRANGHPEGYDGPCWGPTRDELNEAARLLLAERDDAEAAHSDQGQA